jgi:hypothetical protein
MMLKTAQQLMPALALLCVLNLRLDLLLLLLLFAGIDERPVAAGSAASLMQQAAAPALLATRQLSMCSEPPVVWVYSRCICSSYFDGILCRASAAFAAALLWDCMAIYAV